MGQIKKITYSDQIDPVLFAQGFRAVNFGSGVYLPVSGVFKKGMFALLVNGVVTTVYKSGKVYEAVTSGTSVKMYKDHSYGIGDAIYDGATGRTVSAIDRTSSTAYDTLTVSGAVSFTLDEVVYSIESGNITSANGIVIIASNTNFDITADTYASVPVTVAIMALLKGDHLPNYWEKTTNPNVGMIHVDGYYS